MLTRIDYAGSGKKLYNAISQHTDHDIGFYSEQIKDSWAIPRGGIDVKKMTDGDLQVRVDRSDIIHIKGDWPAQDGYLGLQIMNKPVVQTVCGTFFRKRNLPEHNNNGLGKFPMSLFVADLKTAFTPDLLYPEYSNLWTPHPIDSVGKPVLWERKEKPVFLHMPTHRERKGTPFILNIFDELSKHIDFDLNFIEGVSHEESLEQKRCATMFFDQSVVGFYGNSAIEAMQYGIPTIAWLSPESISRIPAGCPVVTAQRTEKAFCTAILAALEDDTLSQRTKEWCDKYHSYQAVSSQWDDLYKKL